MMRHKVLIRNLDSGDFLESFLVSAIASILIIRTYLYLTGFPQIGNGDFHIAHMLWGGLFMCVAICLMFTYMGRGVIYFSSILGGIGFGTFIDELGKFITRDNNYFFEPTIALIYVIFVGIYLIAKFSQKYRRISEEEYLVNAIDYLKEAILLDLDKVEKRKALDLLRKCNPHDSIVQAVKSLIKSVDTIPDRKSNIIDKVYIFFRTHYISIIRHRWFTYFVIAFFVVESIIAVVYALEFLNVFSLNLLLKHNPDFGVVSYDHHDYGEIISSFIAVTFVWMGILRIKFSRLKAYIDFKRSILISIFLTQFFAFLDLQFWALIGLFFNITVLLALDFMIGQEKDIEELKKEDLPVEAKA